MEARKYIGIQIDVTKIDKEKLYKGAKGTYLNATILLKNEPDQYGQYGVILQDVTKEERESGEKGAILGNVRRVYDRNEPKPRVSNPEPVEDDGLLPF